MKHQISSKDVAFLQSFTSCQFDPEKFHHREHIRLAYILLVQDPFQDALTQIKQGILNFLAFHGADASKYHETMTSAWLSAVQHFMYISDPTPDSEAFIAANTIILDKEIMYTHYTRELMDSEKAKHSVVEADLELIPIHG